MSDLTWRLHRPHLLGVYLAVNALRDARLVVDGPTCLFYKGEFIQGSHDWASSLLACDGRHRIWHSDTDVNRASLDNEPRLVTLLEDAGKGASVVLLSALPFCVVAGTDYARLARQASRRGGRPTVLVPGRSLEGDWLRGYGDVLCALAEAVPIPKGPRRKDAVAVVGHMMDRNEADRRGDAAELRRLLRGLGLDPVSVWLSGEGWEELCAAGRAGLVVSLPYGRRAARRLAARLGARLVETDLPLGLEGTRRWLERVGEASGRRARARDLAREEAARAVPALERVVAHALTGRRVAFAGDPHLCEALDGLLREFGASIGSAWLMADGAGLDAAVARRLRGRGAVFQPTRDALEAAWREASGSTDLVVANSHALEWLRPARPWMELGFPSQFTHCLREDPMLGFTGCLSLVERMANAAARAAAFAR